MIRLEHSRPVIVVGAPRSGTYWIVEILRSRFNVHCPSETHFIPLFGASLALWGDLGRRENRARLLTNIFEFVAVWTARSSASAEYLQQIRPLSLLAVQDAGRAGTVVDESRDYASLIDRLFTHFADLQGAAGYGDKSAHYRALAPERTLRHLPDAQVVHIVRDGRDVALSWTGQWFGPSSIGAAAREWRRHVAVNRAWGRRNPGRYLELRYEDLAAAPEAEIERLGCFLGRRPASGPDGPSPLAAALSATDSHARMTTMVASGNVRKWEAEMSPAARGQFERLAGDVLRECGYPAAAAAATRLTLPRPSLHRLRVAAKVTLPVCLRACAMVGLPALPLLNRGFPEPWRRTDAAP